MNIAMLATAAIEAEHKRKERRAKRLRKKEEKELADLGLEDELEIPEEDLIPVPPGWDFGWDFPED